MYNELRRVYTLLFIVPTLYWIQQIVKSKTVIRILWLYLTKPCIFLQPVPFVFRTIRILKNRLEFTIQEVRYEYLIRTDIFRKLKQTFDSTADRYRLSFWSDTK